jgi:ribosomal RNA assembly protein
MVRKLTVENMRLLKRAVPKIESKVKVRFSFGNDFVIIRGKETDEFLVEEIVQAVDFGFDVEDALLLLQEDYMFEIVDIRSFTHRKNLHDVRSRVIGRSGKSLNTIENLTGAILHVSGNLVGIISHAENLENVNQAIESLVRGSKHGNVFSYLEKRNKTQRRRELIGKDLGLREKIKKKFFS